MKSLPANLQSQAVLLASKGLTNREIARTLGIPYTTVWRWVNKFYGSTYKNKFRAKESKQALYVQFINNLKRGKSLVKSAELTDICMTTARKWAKKAGIQTEGQKKFDRTKKNSPPESNL